MLNATVTAINRLGQGALPCYLVNTAAVLRCYHQGTTADRGQPTCPARPADSLRTLSSLRVHVLYPSSRPLHLRSTCVCNCVCLCVQVRRVWCTRTGRRAWRWPRRATWWRCQGTSLPSSSEASSTPMHPMHPMHPVCPCCVVPPARPRARGRLRVTAVECSRHCRRAPDHAHSCKAPRASSCVQPLLEQRRGTHRLLFCPRRHRHRHHRTQRARPPDARPERVV